MRIPAVSHERSLCTWRAQAREHEWHPMHLSIRGAVRIFITASFHWFLSWTLETRVNRYSIPWTDSLTRRASGNNDLPDTEYHQERIFYIGPRSNRLIPSLGYIPNTPVQPYGRCYSRSMNTFGSGFVRDFQKMSTLADSIGDEGRWKLIGFPNRVAGGEHRGAVRQVFNARRIAPNDNRGN